MSSTPAASFGKELCKILKLEHCETVAIIHRVGECPRVVATLLVIDSDKLTAITKLVKRYELTPNHNES